MTRPGPERPGSFGSLSDGREVNVATLTWPGGLTVQVLSYGAAVHSIRFPTAAGDLEITAGLPALADYEADTAYHGVIVGRCANRIDQARFTLDGETFEVTANEGPTCLHGGKLGLSKRLWRFEQAERLTATLAYDSPDGEEGFPGALACRVRFELVAADVLEITWEAETDRATPINLTHHLYFNLSGGGGTTILDHELTVAAEAITPVDGRLIPIGDLSAVADTPFDFRIPRQVGERVGDPDPQLGPGGGYDHNFALSGAQPAVRLRSPKTGVTLEIETDQPGMQLYGGQGLKAPFVSYGWLALEPQGFPDAINRPEFPSVAVRPGEVYRRRARYRFSAGPPG